MLGFLLQALCDKKEVKFDCTDIFGGEGFVQVLFLLLSLFVLVFFMFFVLVFALLVKLNFYCYYFLYVRRFIFSASSFFVLAPPSSGPGETPKQGGTLLGHNNFFHF